MKKKILSILLILALAVFSLLADHGLSAAVQRGEAETAPDEEPVQTQPAETDEPAPVYEERDFVISVVGDCTLASPQFIDPTEHRSLEYRIQENYAYPFSNTVEYFRNDDLTLANLECVFCDTKLYSIEQFSFRAPTAYTQIMLEGCVDFVTTANNHLEDFGEQGISSTYETLDNCGLPYGKDGEAQIITTESGLKVGIYCCTGENHGGFLELGAEAGEAAMAAIRQLRADGAEYVICAFHWGKELVYSPREDQVELAHACIDAGADLIYGSHSHCLQPMEEYNGGIILYSMGNWSFGGSTAPSDRDTAIVQVKLHRDETGKVTNTGFEIIPCCVSSRPVNEGYTGDNYNDYRPTPYTEGSEAYYRVLAKLDGSFEPDKEGRDYSDVYAQYS